MAEWSRNTPWRQGSLLSLSTAEGLGLNHPEQGSETVVIVASHDCDISQDVAVEPNIEVVIGKVLCVDSSSLDGNYTHAKNARTLHIPLAGETTQYVEFVSANKQSINKRRLLDYQPDSHFRIEREFRIIFQRWLAFRYRRSAFPDEFERRLKQNKLHQKIANAMKKTGDHIAAIFLMLMRAKR